MGTRAKKDRRNAKRAASREFVPEGSPIVLPNGREMLVGSLTADPRDAGEYVRLDDPRTPPMVKALAEGATDYGRRYLENYPDTPWVVAGAHAFPTTEEHLLRIGFAGAVVRTPTGQLIVPLPWVGTPAGVDCDESLMDAVEPAVLEHFRRDLRAAAAESDVVAALVLIAEDPLRYLGEVA